MNLSSYLNLCLSKGLYKDKRWILLTSTQQVSSDHSDIDFMPYVEDGKWYFKDQEGKVEQITGVDVEGALFRSKQPVEIEPQVVEGVFTKKVKTFARRAILAAILLHPLGGAVAFTNEAASPGAMATSVESSLREKRITASQYKRHREAAEWAKAILVPYVTPTPSEELNELDEDIIKLRDKLYEENKEKLHDPKVIAEIEAKLIAMLTEKVKKSKSAGFYVKRVLINKTMKKTMVSFGAARDPNDPTKVIAIKRSLEEGYDPYDLPYVYSDARTGSYKRGKETQFGGVASKQSNRTFQNTQVVGDDCGTKVGDPVVISNYNYEKYVGHYLMSDTKTPLTVTALKKLIGKTVLMRLPTTCITEDGNYCKVCVGSIIANSGLSIGPQAAETTSAFLAISLAAFHGKELKTVRFKPEEFIN